MERLRFKDENGKEYPNWENTQLGELGSFKTSSVDKKVYKNQKIVNLVNYMDVYNNVELSNNTVSNFMKVSATENQLIENNLEVGDILFTPSSETPDDIGHSTVIREDLENTLYSYHVVRYRPNIRMDLNYSNYFCNTNKILSEMAKLSQGATRFTLSLKSFKEVRTNISKSIEEQQKIGGFLSAIDKLVDKQREKVELLKEMKKGYLQKIFNQELRFKDVNGNDYPEWEKTNLGAISEGITKGTTPKTYTSYGVRFVKVESLNNNKVVKTKCSYISVQTHEKELNRSILKNGDLLFSIAGTLGRVAYVENDILPANTNQALSIITLNFQKVDKQYLISNIYDNKVKLYVYKNVTVGAQPNLNLQQVANFPVELPVKFEQIKIGETLTAIDSIIEFQTKKLVNLEMFKKGYMQRLFT